MKIFCLKGYFKIYEDRAGEVSDFSSIFGGELERVEDYFTFADIAECPEFSIAGLDFLGVPALATFAGKPWEIFEANEFVYNYDLGLIVPIASITTVVSLDQALNYYLSPGLILPGSLTEDGSRVTDYAAWFSKDLMKFRYSEVTSD